jgi:hypothetical protein
VRTAVSALVLLIAAANVNAYVRGGPGGVYAWWRSKLVGQ